MVLEFTLKEILIYGTPLLTGVFILLMVRRRSASEQMSRVRTRTICLVHGILLSVFIASTAISIHVGFRPFAWFLVITALFFSSILLGFRANRTVWILLFITVIIMAISVPVAIYAGNNFYPGGWESESIFKTGTLETYQAEAMNGGVYYFIPITTLNGAAIGLVTGSLLYIPMFLTAAWLVVILSGILILFRRLHSNGLVVVAGVFFFMSIPVFSIFGRSGIFSYSLLFMWFALARYRSPLSAVIGVLVVGIVMILGHPLGIAYVIAMLLPVAVLRIKDWPVPGKNGKGIAGLLLMMLVITVAYWTYTYLLSLGVRMGVSFYGTIMSYFSGPTQGGGESYVPRYSIGGFEIFGYAWAVPIALSAAYFLVSSFSILRHRKVSGERLTLFASFLGPMIVLIAYASYPTGETGQYLIPVGYMVTILAASACVRILLANPGKARRVTALVFLVPVVFVGTFSPDWAPLEHPDFQTSATLHPYYVYLEAATVTAILPANATVYYDYDFPLRGSSYKPIRDVIDSVSLGADPAVYARPPSTFFGMRSERFQPLPDWHWHVIYSSGFHVVTMVDTP